MYITISCIYKKYTATHLKCCVYKTANIRGKALHVAVLSQVIFIGTGTDY